MAGAPPPPPLLLPPLPPTPSSRTSPPSLANSPGVAAAVSPAIQGVVVGHFVCEGCGIKFKSGTNLQAHQARYCAGLRNKVRTGTDPINLVMITFISNTLP
jgi:hypothetical protein